MSKEQSGRARRKQTKILLSSVFGPYARDDEYGSRVVNPMELYQNQVTRLQGGFSLRMFHRSFGLMLIQANIDAPCTLLDFPTLERFTAELKSNSYDVIGISAIATNIRKVRKMCDLIREHQPQAEIVIGGHIANKEGIDKSLRADHIVRGDGVRWFRNYLGEDENAAIKHPMVFSGFGARCMGINLPGNPKTTAAILIPSVGCPMGCNFCSTSALFGGKGKFISFYETGDELFSVMCQLEAKLKTQSFFTMDENFLLHRRRALRLLELMREHNKSWSLYVFSSARVLRSYTMEQLVGLGISWVWMGLEGENSAYSKLKNVDTRALVKSLQAHGIRVLGSTIVGLEHHTPQNISGVIDYAVAHATDFHQFMLYTPVPGTPFHEQHRADGTLLPEEEFDPADAHGQYRFNYRHAHIPAGREEDYLLEAFRRDFRVNGPSLARLTATMLKGWRHYKKHPDLRIRKRFKREAKPLRIGYAGAIWAMRRWYRDNEEMRTRMDGLLQALYSEFGPVTRIITPVIGRYIYSTFVKEERRLEAGWSYEPQSHYEKNAAAAALEKESRKETEQAPCRTVAACVPQPGLSFRNQRSLPAAQASLFFDSGEPEKKSAAL